MSEAARDGARHRPANTAIYVADDDILVRDGQPMRDIERFARASRPFQIKGALKIDGDRVMGDPAVSELAPFGVQSNHRPPNAFLDRQAFANGTSRAQQLFETLELLGPSGAR